MSTNNPQGRADGYVEVATIAAYLNCSDRTVRRMLAQGLRHVKFGAGQQAAVRIAWADLESWLNEHAVER
ncbi:helix-turn-helix domain-containing protein [Nocardioides sp. SOB44]|uniref:Helix-turn-helix domain-containing protein n=1 Tax=Nocardioides cremeus TaxID=3058044 RepID=A0ABT8TZY2_9ACTN|nr:helix-turn-helix domain-containing protein [Nocardioides cremeus]MDO3398101.1 helix-turn-helix domain-containing protein [Nocardioides cremeus]